MSCLPYILGWYTSGWAGNSGYWYVCERSRCFGWYWTWWCHCNDWHISGCISIINITTNLSYKKDVRSSRSTSDSPFTPPWQICLIKIRHHLSILDDYTMALYIFTIPFYIIKHVLKCIWVSNLKTTHGLKLMHLTEFWLLYTACMANDVAMRTRKIYG